MWAFRLFLLYHVSHTWMHGVYLKLPQSMTSVDSKPNTCCISCMSCETLDNAYKMSLRWRVYSPLNLAAFFRTWGISLPARVSLMRLSCLHISLSYLCHFHPFLAIFELLILSKLDAKCLQKRCSKWVTEEIASPPHVSFILILSLCPEKGPLFTCLPQSLLNVTRLCLPLSSLPRPENCTHKRTDTHTHAF